MRTGMDEAPDERRLVAVGHSTPGGGWNVEVEAKFQSPIAVALTIHCTPQDAANMLLNAFGEAWCRQLDQEWPWPWGTTI